MGKPGMPGEGRNAATLPPVTLHCRPTEGLWTKGWERPQWGPLLRGAWGPLHTGTGLTGMMDSAERQSLHCPGAQAPGFLLPPAVVRGVSGNKTPVVFIS